MTFDATIIHWKTIAEFTLALKTIRRPAWVRGITHHNTFVPDDLDWRGMASMTSMRDYYRDTKGWTSGPHLYLCAQAPNGNDTGIWQMTPITHMGTHAGACNADHLGIENVGDFQDRAPSPDQYALLLQVTRLILQQWGLPPERVQAHNECMTGRTCPGKHLTGAQIRADLQRSVPRPPPLITARYRVAVRISQLQEGGAPYTGELVSGEEVLIDLTYGNGMAHLADQRGFVPLAALEIV